MAFPRLNAMGFWTTLFSGGLLVYSLKLPHRGRAAGPGMVPVRASSPPSARSRGAPATDLWCLGLIVSGVGTIAAAVNFIATILGPPRPGDGSIRKVPFFVWTMLWTSVQITPWRSRRSRPRAGDEDPPRPPAHGARISSTCKNGGSAYLWQHLFWFFGHPEVYILILPVFGMVSEVIPDSSPAQVLFGYEFMAMATMAIAFISLGVWAHHMFTVGMRTRGRSTCSSSRRACSCSVPTGGSSSSNWLATMHGGRLSFAPPMLLYRLRVHSRCSSSAA